MKLNASKVRAPTLTMEMRLREVQSVMTDTRLRGGAQSQDITHLTSKENNGLDLRQLCPLKKALFEQ